MAAPADAQPQIADPEAHVVEELVVTARERGPAWWRVSDEDTTVYILALPDAGLPRNVKWDTARLEQRLKGANALIGGGPNLRVGLRDAPLLLSVRKSLRTKGGMEDDLPEPLRIRFVAAREKLGQPAQRYEAWGPLAAGMMLAGDSRTGRWRDIEPQVRALARKLNVRQPRLPQRSAAPLIRQFKAGLTPDIQTRCMDAALGDVEAGTGRATAAARGWAEGDVRKALTAPRGFEKCLLILAGGSEAWRQNVEDQAAAIAQALKQPGRTVAMVRLRQLIAEGGVIARLEAVGLEVEGPVG
jgi:hypothetical protein